MQILRNFLILFNLFLFTLLPYPALALRCQNEVIAIGDLKAKVLQYCGKPSFKEKIKNPKKNRTHQQQKLISQEYWTYNFGPQNFLYLIDFEQGKVKNISTSHYGY